MQQVFHSTSPLSQLAPHSTGSPSNWSRHSTGSALLIGPPFNWSPMHLVPPFKWSPMHLVPLFNWCPIQLVPQLTGPPIQLVPQPTGPALLTGSTIQLVPHSISLPVNSYPSQLVPPVNLSLGQLVPQSTVSTAGLYSWPWWYICLCSVYILSYVKVSGGKLVTGCNTFVCQRTFKTFVPRNIFPITAFRAVEVLMGPIKWSPSCKLPNRPMDLSQQEFIPILSALPRQYFWTSDAGI